MSNTSIQNLLVIGPTGKNEYQSLVQDVISKTYTGAGLEVSSTDVYEILGSLGYSQDDLKNPAIVEQVASLIAQTLIRLIKEKNALQVQTVDGKTDPHSKFCAAIDSNCVVSLSVKSKLQLAQAELPEIEFIDVPFTQCNVQRTNL